jgi:hypothetical protein
MDGCLSCCNGMDVVGCYMYEARLCTAWLVKCPKAVRSLLLMTCGHKGLTLWSGS